MSVAGNHRPSDALVIPANPKIGFQAAVHIIMLCILFGANAVAIKMTFEGFGVFSAAVIRFSIAAMAIALWAFLSGRSFRLEDGQWKHLLVYSILFTAQLSLFYVGLSRTYASRGTLLINMLPFLILILARAALCHPRKPRTQGRNFRADFPGLLVDLSLLTVNLVRFSILKN